MVKLRQTHERAFVQTNRCVIRVECASEGKCNDNIFIFLCLLYAFVSLFSDKPPETTYIDIPLNDSHPAFPLPLSSSLAFLILAWRSTLPSGLTHTLTKNTRSASLALQYSWRSFSSLTWLIY